MANGRQELGGSKVPTSPGAPAKPGASPKSQTIKLVLACTMLATAAALIAWQSGIFAGASPAPAAATGTAGSTQQAPDSPEVPVTKTGSGRAKPLEQK